MNNTARNILFILCMSIFYLSGCNSQEDNSSPKLNEYVEVISVKEGKKDNYEIEYELKKDIDKGNGLTTQTIYFDNGKEHAPLVSDKKGKEKVTIKGSQIKLVYNSSNKYIEEQKVK